MVATVATARIRNYHLPPLWEVTEALTGAWMAL